MRIVQDSVFRVALATVLILGAELFVTDRDPAKAAESVQGAAGTLSTASTRLEFTSPARDVGAGSQSDREQAPLAGMIRPGGLRHLMFMESLGLHGKDLRGSGARYGRAIRGAVFVRGRMGNASIPAKLGSGIARTSSSPR